MAKFDDAIAWSREMGEQAEVGAFSLDPELAEALAAASEAMANDFTKVWWDAQPFEKTEGFGLVQVAQALTARVLSGRTAQTDEIESVILQGIEFSQNMARAYRALGRADAFTGRTEEYRAAVTEAERAEDESEE